jgi:hypothetical protein
MSRVILSFKCVWPMKNDRETRWISVITGKAHREEPFGVWRAAELTAGAHNGLCKNSFSD